MQHVCLGKHHELLQLQLELELGVELELELLLGVELGVELQLHMQKLLKEEEDPKLQVIHLSFCSEHHQHPPYHAW